MEKLPPNFGKTTDNPVPFGDRLSALVAFEMACAHGNPERMAEILERLLHSVSFTISIMAAGDPKRTENLLTGAEAYLTERAVGFAKFGRLIEGARRVGKRL